ncbi:MAG: TM1812 family CRISPR-associated protein [Thermoproteus sp.]
MGRALVLASWGLPTKWNEGLYIRPKIPQGRCPRPSEVEYVEERAASRTSLSAVINTVREAGHEPDLVIIGLDTLAFPGSLDRLHPEAVKALEGLYAKAQRGEVGYGDVVEAARAVLAAYVRSYLQGYAEAERAEVVVVPGSGVYRAGGRATAYFHSDLRNAETAVLAKLYEKAQRSYDAVVVDMTHGVNYLASTLYKASEVVARYISAAQRREVCYAVFNSDPVQSNKDRARINIVKLEQIGEEPSLFVGRAAEELEDRLYVMTKPVRADPPILDLDRQYRALSEKARLHNIAQALAYGFGLYIFEKARALSGMADEARRLVGEALAAIYNTVRVEAQKAARSEQEELAVAVERTYGIDPSPVHLAMALDVFAKNFGGLQTDEEGGVDLDLLRGLPLHEPASTILIHEIDEIKERIYMLGGAALPEGLYLDYNHIYELTNMPAIQLRRKIEGERPAPCEGAEESGVVEGQPAGRPAESKREECDLNKRNYIAHAGLERTAICVKVQGGKMYVRYKRRCREALERILAGGTGQPQSGAQPAGGLT